MKMNIMILKNKVEKERNEYKNKNFQTNNNLKNDY